MVAWSSLLTAVLVADLQAIMPTRAARIGVVFICVEGNAKVGEKKGCLSWIWIWDGYWIWEMDGGEVSCDFLPVHANK